MISPEQSLQNIPAVTNAAVSIADLPPQALDRIGFFLGTDAVQLPKLLLGRRDGVQTLPSVRAAQQNVAEAARRAIAMPSSMYDADDCKIFADAGSVLHVLGPKVRAQIIRQAHDIDLGRVLTVHSPSPASRFAVDAIVSRCQVGALEDFDRSMLLRTIMAAGKKSTRTLLSEYSRASHGDRRRIREHFTKDGVPYNAHNVIAKIPSPFIGEFLAAATPRAIRLHLPRFEEADHAAVLGSLAVSCRKITAYTEDDALDLAIEYFAHYAALAPSNRAELWDSVKLIAYQREQAIRGRGAHGSTQPLYSDLMRAAFPHRETASPNQISSVMQGQFEAIEAEYAPQPLVAHPAAAPPAAAARTRRFAFGRP